MNILILGDIVGPSGRKALTKRLPELIKKKKIRFCNCQWRKCGRYRCWNN